MTNELMNAIISAIISAVTGAVAGGVVTLLLDKRKERREDKKERQKEKKEIYDKRPELKITEYKDYLDRPGHKLKKECDINVFMTRMEKVSVENDIVTAHYNKEFFNEQEWCCVIYEFKNVGGTDIQTVAPICTYKKDAMFCNVVNAQMILEQGLLCYSTLYDRKVRIGESFIMRLCYHKDCIGTGMLSSNMLMGIEDSNNRYWAQPLFAPYNKIYDANRITYEQYQDYLLPDSAIECFKKPWLW